MPNTGRSRSLGQVVEEFCTQNETSGGSSETGTKVLAARPKDAEMQKVKAAAILGMERLLRKQPP